MIRKLFVVLACLVSATLMAAEPASKTIPKPLAEQVERLVELLRSDEAVGAPDSTMVQLVKHRKDQELALVVFTVAGYGGGNMYTQYLAAFTPEKEKNGRQHFTLIDVISIGGKFGRGIDSLNARVTYNQKSFETAIAIDAKEFVEGDTPLSKSKKVVINLMINKHQRLLELNKP
jgi:hypothetical protein